MKRPAWAITARLLGRAREWTHVSGVAVRHCGHPTANYPYYIVGREGRTFALLKDAKAAALKPSQEQTS